jgi:aryl-alcohol dehydrogenase-like predicted oxidoreductase
LSEEILGKAIKQHSLPRDEIVIMTKVNCSDTYLRVVADVDLQVFFPVSSTTADAINIAGQQGPDEHGFVNQHGLSRKHIFESVKHSLRRLQLDYIDVLQCHRFDNDTPIEETMQALHDVVKAGYVRYIGMSSCYAHQCECFQVWCELGNP